MKKEMRVNADKYNPENQYQTRLSIVRLLEQGKANNEIAVFLDVSDRHVRSVRKQYAEGGLDALRPRKRGRGLGEKRLLTAQQEREILKIMVEQEPAHFGMRERLWSRKAVLEMILQKYQRRIELSTLGYYFRRWGLQVRLPVKRNPQGARERIDQWLDRVFPGMLTQAQMDHAEIFFGEEVYVQIIRADRGAVGEPPSAVRANGLSAVSKRGKLRFSLFEDGVNEDGFIDFMRKLASDSGRKVYLIVDGIPGYRSPKVTEWLWAHRAEVEVFYLPPYEPDKLR